MNNKTRQQVNPIKLPTGRNPIRACKDFTLAAFSPTVINSFSFKITDQQCAILQCTRCPYARRHTKKTTL